MNLRSLSALIALLAPLLTTEVLAQSPTVEEEVKLARLLEKFPEADADANGEVSMAESRAFLQARRAAEKARLGARARPTHADLIYGSHERNVIDVWLPESAESAATPIPMIVFFHGGGFVGGDKSGFDPSPFLAAGFAAASANYRFVDGEGTLCPAPMEDAARAVQFLKSKAAEWNLDKERFALSGGSAGAVIAMWIGYHDDRATPDSEDPILRELTRVAAVMPINGPTNLEPAWIRQNLGGPEHIHGSIPKMYGPDWATPEGNAAILRTSPWELVSEDDPPTFLVYTTEMTEVPLPTSASTGELIHHPHFGVAMRARLENLGVPVHFVHSFDPREASALADFAAEVFASP